MTQNIQIKQKKTSYKYVFVPQIQGGGELLLPTEVMGFGGYCLHLVFFTIMCIIVSV